MVYSFLCGFLSVHQLDRESDSSSVITARRHSGDTQIKFMPSPGQSVMLEQLELELVGVMEEMVVEVEVYKYKTMRGSVFISLYEC